MNDSGDTALNRSRVGQLRQQAAQRWSDLLGDSSACSLAKDGRSYPAAKFNEGQAASLGELLRLIDADSSVEKVRDAAAVVLARWENEPHPHAAHSADWDAYRAGGIQAMSGILTP